MIRNLRRFNDEQVLPRIVIRRFPYFAFHLADIQYHVFGLRSGMDYQHASFEADGTREDAHLVVHTLDIIERDLGELVSQRFQTVHDE